jgi:hypothetical protein
VASGSRKLSDEVDFELERDAEPFVDGPAYPG